MSYLFYDDAAAMLDWYARVFGFVETARWCAADGSVHNAEMSVADGVGEIWLDGGGVRKLEADGRPALPWTGVFVDDLDAVYERVRGAGIEVPPPDRKEYGVTMLMVTDPSGHQWGFMELAGS